MIIHILSFIVVAVSGFLGGCIVGYTGTIRLILLKVNALVAEREKMSSTVAMMELPGLTLFRQVLRLRQF